MEEKKAGLDVLKLIKTSYDSTLDNVVKMQDQGEKILKDVISRAKEGQAEAEKILNEFLTNANKARDEFKKIMDEGFKRVEDLFK